MQNGKQRKNSELKKQHRRTNIGQMTKNKIGIS